jgi:hypothetical protein
MASHQKAAQTAKITTRPHPATARRSPQAGRARQEAPARARSKKPTGAAASKPSSPAPFAGPLFEGLRALLKLAGRERLSDDSAEAARVGAAVTIVHALRALVLMLDTWGSSAADRVRWTLEALDSDRGIVLHNPHPGAPPMMRVDAPAEPFALERLLGFNPDLGAADLSKLSTLDLLDHATGNGEPDPVLSLLGALAGDLGILNVALSSDGDVTLPPDRVIDALWSAERRARVAAELHRRMRLAARGATS